METPVLNSHNKSEYEPAADQVAQIEAKVISHSFESGVWRLRWKVINQ